MMNECDRGISANDCVNNASTLINGYLKSIQIGLPRQFGTDSAADPMDRTWTTGFYKDPVTGPIRMTTTNLDGDGQADLENHGGRDKAVLAYSEAHYDYWRTTLNIPTLPFGAFGENLTIAHLTEATVCIGDIWTVGDEVVVQVSQPRQPCWKLARRWRVKTLALQVQQNGYTGWYFRVLNEGMVDSGMPMTLLDRPYPDWTVERANRVMHHDTHDLHTAAELAALPLLAASWQLTLNRRVDRGVNTETSTS